MIPRGFQKLDSAYQRAAQRAWDLKNNFAKFAQGLNRQNTGMGGQMINPFGPGQMGGLLGQGPGGAHKQQQVHQQMANPAMQQMQAQGGQGMSPNYYYGTANISAASSTATANIYVTNSTSSATTTFAIPHGTASVVVHNAPPPQAYYPPELKIDPKNGRGAYLVQNGYPVTLGLPDGTRVEVKADGSFEVIDTDAKITYKASRLREFNAYINASDKLEEFMQFCKEAGVDAKDDMLGMPIKLFIAWLIQEAAKADKEPEIPDVPLIPDLRKRITPRCIQCNRFIKRELARKQVMICSTRCFERQQLLAA